MRVVISGGGKVGEYLATVLLASGNEVTIIERDADVADRLSMLLSGRYLVIVGDGCDSKSQEDAGIRRADVFVATTGQDDNNLVACEIAQRVFNVPRAVARVNAPKNQRIFRTLGIESVSSTQLIANLIEEETLLGSMSTITSLTHSNVLLTEIVVPRFRNHAEEEGVLVADLDMPEGSIIAAVALSDRIEVVGPETVVHPGDRAIVIADQEAVDDVRDMLRSL
ncbi:MAG: TrkA family potassium uptake protein [Berryella intestinalis]|uniref:Trk system potassium uptake protein TrkA n=1 Tax=Berryella intestinalis TaxID=1531429 RepID=A0A0A8B5I5_9ACTN|nr:TrkA family potassium uptake protein [Berryella intestinalis]AJC12579.1 potassium transporter TrkA [Berryella intestinalis]MDD7368753.1 TrkA family potassium uptake protein [Berryella intestinalis]MDY3129707.1 TrkA family potassium uptake protein [Berryella intestinalis]